MKKQHAILVLVLLFVFIPASALIATFLPALAGLGRWPRGAAAFGRLYGANTAGAVLGSLLAHRVTARLGQGGALFAAILAKQTPDAEKRARADFVIDTSHGKDAARARVREILDKLRNGQLSERT